MTDPHLLPYSMIGCDIESFSARTTYGQAQLRHDFFELFTWACVETGVGLAEPGLRDGGDGGLGLFAADVPRGQLVAELPRKLAEALERRNSDRKPEARLRVRLALHHGLAHRDGESWVSNALNVTARILNAQAGRTLLARVSEANLVLLVSEQMYADTVDDRLVGLDPLDFARIRLASGEKGAGISAWASLWSNRQFRPQQHALAGLDESPERTQPPASGSSRKPTAPQPTEPIPGTRHVHSEGSNSPAVGGDVGEINIGTTR